jgi:transposase
MGASEAAKRRAGHVQAWRRSGLTQAAYCEKHELNRHTLAYWCSQTRRRKDRVSDTASARFVPLRVKDAVRVEKDEAVASAALELWFPSGLRARIAAGMDAEWAAAVLGSVTC